MRVINTKVHGVLDYLVGVLLIASPWLFGFARGGAETWVPVILGAGAIIYSLITAYEYSASKIISVPTHLTLDILSGIFLAASPWIFGFDEYVYLPHLILGIGEVGVAMMTEKAPRETVVNHDRARNEGRVQETETTTHTKAKAPGTTGTPVSGTGTTGSSGTDTADRNVQNRGAQTRGTQGRENPSRSTRQKDTEL